MWLLASHHGGVSVARQHLMVWPARSHSASVAQSRASNLESCGRIFDCCEKVRERLRWVLLFRDILHSYPTAVACTSQGGQDYGNSTHGYRSATRGVFLSTTNSR
mmetsp:Transcript_77077/g.133372  ORF Transcript_77077/g.133372 Transcript_77077/m.133372 type:complete len:105 (+) Transcript_77077:347-661(+)